MSSPHVGGDYLNSMAARRTAGSRNDNSTGSGRNTPLLGASPHRSIPAQLANPYGRPIPTNQNQNAAGGANGSDDEEEEMMRRNGQGWRAITPSRASPRPGQSQQMQPTNHHQQQQLSTSSSSQSIPHDDIAAPLNPSPSGNDVSLGGVEVRFSQLPPVLKGYLLGQIACVIKFGIWWVGFTYLILALFGGDSYLVGATRICFNLALLLCSPMAGSIAEKTNIKKLLNKTVIVRGLIYSVFIPIAWIIMDSSIFWDHNSHALHVAFFIIFLTIIFIDGLGVSFSNVADIDSGGVNLVAAQYQIEIDDNIRNYFNSLHIMFFDLSMVIFNPILAYVGLFIGQHTVGKQDEDSNVGNAVDELTLLIAIGGVFAISTIMTLVCYNVYMPDIPKVASDALTEHSIAASPPHGMSLNADDNVISDSPSQIPIAEPDSFTFAQFKELMSSVYEGAQLTWANTRIRYRVLFFAIETSVEDAMIALIAAEIGSQVFAAEYTKLHYAYGNLWGAGLVAVGKLGGVLASILMHKYFSFDADASDSSKAFRPLFIFAAVGGCCSLILPLSYHFRDSGELSHTASTIILFIGMFLFFLFSTLSKIGFSTLMQSMAAEIEATGRVFGFVAAFVTAIDALILMAMAALFSACGLRLALWISCGFIAVHGLIELVFGPGLVLKKEPKSLDEQLRMDLAQPLV